MQSYKDAQKKNITISKKKLELGKKVTFARFEVSADGVQPTKVKNALKQSLIFRHHR